MTMIESASDVCQIELPCSLLIAMVVTFIARRRLLPCNRVHICSHEFVTCVFALLQSCISGFSHCGSMSLMDVPIIRRTDTRATRGGQRSRQTLVLQDGLPVLGIVLGMPVGRWHAEFTADTSAGREASRLLCHAIGVGGLSQLLSSNAVALGMVVLQSWRFVHDIASHEQTWCMMEAVKAAHRRCNGMHVLEHVALATHEFSELSNDIVLPDTWSFMYCHALGRILLQEVSRSTRGSCMHKLTEWEAQFGSLQASVVAWPVWTPLAHALVRGTWYGDVSPRFERDNAGGYLQAPVMPSQRLLRLFCKFAMR